MSKVSINNYFNLYYNNSMAHVLQEFGIPEDIWKMIEEINYKKHLHEKLLPELSNSFQNYWREKFRNYENRL